MFTARNETSRREFVQLFGLGVAGVWSARRSPTVGMQDPCAPPAHGTAVPFTHDCRPIRPRQIADRLTSAEVTQLKAAYQAMRDLDASDPIDPRGFRQQANVHCYYCATSDASRQVHWTWKFFVWHRAYLYFHERILGKLIGNENFRLPFWGWDSPLYHRLPTAYATDGGNPLYNGTRTLAAGDPLPDEDVGANVINDVLTLSSFDLFGGTATSSGVPEGTPHGSVHGDVGGDMGTFERAARDPIFYQHHATVDKLWSDWIKASAAHTNPISTAFRDLTLNFFDENKVWRSIKASQVLDHEHSLRYVFEPYRFWDIFPCLRWRPITIGWRVTQRIQIPNTQPLVISALREDAPVRLDLLGVQVPRDRTTTYRIYATRTEAQRDGGPGSHGYIGAVGVVLNDPDNKHPMPGTANVSVTIRSELRARLAGGEALQPFLVDRADRSPDKRLIPMRAADVLVTVGSPDRDAGGMNRNR